MAVENIRRDLKSRVDHFCWIPFAQIDKLWAMRAQTGRGWGHMEQWVDHSVSVGDGSKIRLSKMVMLYYIPAVRPRTGKVEATEMEDRKHSNVAKLLVYDTETLIHLSQRDLVDFDAEYTKTPMQLNYSTVICAEARIGNPFRMTISRFQTRCVYDRKTTGTIARRCAIGWGWNTLMIEKVGIKINNLDTGGAIPSQSESATISVLIFQNDPSLNHSSLFILLTCSVKQMGT
ncbi:hypothetical protein BDN71DRAFT_1436435 [Pleurotus eryngii]|uniref:Uncharacterized protein n=1 Tax=Pleurotus eryngii TaxID=5323 RepID=A0A9P6D0T7_PLEER|nr:hypothetical protein BDN71DRAFT_1436435 [Pleurotus eryngii]